MWYTLVTFLGVTATKFLLSIRGMVLGRMRTFALASMG